MDGRSDARVMSHAEVAASPTAAPAAPIPNSVAIVNRAVAGRASRKVRSIGASGPEPSGRSVTRSAGAVNVMP